MIGKWVYAQFVRLFKTASGTNGIRKRRPVYGCPIVPFNSEGAWPGTSSLYCDTESLSLNFRTWVESADELTPEQQVCINNSQKGRGLSLAKFRRNCLRTEVDNRFNYMVKAGWLSDNRDYFLHS